MVIGYPFIYNGIASELYEASLVFLDENYTNRPSGSEKDVVTDSIIRNAQKIWLDTTQEEVLKFGIEIVFDTPGDIHKLTTLKKWLAGSSGYAPLQICAEGFESYYYNCIIHLDEDLIYNGGYCGVSATVECDAPWAWQIENTKMYNLNVGKTNTIYFNNESDDIEMLKPILTFHMATAGTFSLNCKQFDTNHFDITNTNQTGLTKEEAIRYCRIHNISIKNITPSVYYDKTTVFSNIASDDIVQCDNQWGKITANLTTGIVQKFNKVFLKLPKGKCTLTVTGNADKMYLSYKNAKRMGGGYY